jgi:hypothetical protein
VARHVDLLAADNHDLLAIEELLGDDTGEPAQKMGFGVDNDLVKGVMSVKLKPIKLIPSQFAPLAPYSNEKRKCLRRGVAADIPPL